MRKLISIIMIVTLIAVVFIACARKPTKIRIGYLAITNSLPLYTAVEKGFFKNRSIHAELIKFQTSNDLVEALIAERLDIEISASTAVLYAMELRSPGEFKIFSANIQTKEKFPDYIIVRKDSDISKIEDLKGRKLGTFPGSTFMIIIRLILEKFIDPDQVTIEQIPPPAQVEALGSGRVDAIYTLDPFCILALEKANGKILESAPAEKYVLDPLPGGAAAFSSSFVKKNPKIAKKIVQAFDEAIEFIRTNETQAREYLTKYTPLKPDIARKINIVYFWKSEEIDPIPIQKYADILYAEGGLKGKVDAEKLIFKLK